MHNIGAMITGLAMCLAVSVTAQIPKGVRQNAQQQQEQQRPHVHEGVTHPQDLALTIPFGRIHWKDAVARTAKKLGGRVVCVVIFCEEVDERGVRQIVQNLARFLGSRPALFIAPVFDADDMTVLELEERQLPHVRVLSPKFIPTEDRGLEWEVHNWSPGPDDSALATPHARVHTIHERLAVADNVARFALQVLAGCVLDGNCVQGIPPHVVKDVRGQVHLEFEAAMSGHRAAYERRREITRPLTPSESKQQAKDKLRAIRKEQKKRMEQHRHPHGQTPSHHGGHGGGGRDIHANLRELEHDCAAHHNYTSAQREITGQMRSILVDWLVEVAQEYHLSDETLHLCVHYTDRFLSRLPIQRSRLQLVGITCLRLACKFEEASPLAIDEFVYISDGSYTKDEVLRMESMVLAKLNFSLSAATSKAFLKRYQEVAPLDCSKQTNAEAVLQYEHLANFFLELALQETDCLRWLPSMIAASSICLARVCLGIQPHWTTQLEAFSDYDQSAVRACIVELHALHRKAAFSSLRAVVDKYSLKKLSCVAQLTPLETLPRELR